MLVVYALDPVSMDNGSSLWCLCALTLILHCYGSIPTFMQSACVHIGCLPCFLELNH